MLKVMQICEIFVLHNNNIGWFRGDRIDVESVGKGINQLLDFTVLEVGITEESV